MSHLLVMEGVKMEGLEIMDGVEVMEGVEMKGRGWRWRGWRGWR
jgi:hypothetical protein